jgi:hypothetical protein
VPWSTLCRADWVRNDPGCENVTSLQATKIVFLRSMEIERTKELSRSLSQSQRKAVLSILRADAFSHCQDPVLTTRGWLLRLRPSFSGSCARPCGSERASGSVIDGPGQEGAIAGRPAHDHWMNSPSPHAYTPLFACDDCTFVDQSIARRLQA